MKKIITFGIIALFLITMVTAKISNESSKPIPIDPPIQPSYKSYSNSYVDATLGYEHEFAEIKKVMWCFEQYSSKSAKDITGTNRYLYELV